MYDGDPTLNVLITLFDRMTSQNPKSIILGYKDLLMMIFAGLRSL
jgi:hypothetical protein